MLGAQMKSSLDVSNAGSKSFSASSIAISLRNALHPCRPAHLIIVTSPPICPLGSTFVCRYRDCEKLWVF